jgi:ankyrin repeat protein
MKYTNIDLPRVFFNTQPVIIVSSFKLFRIPSAGFLLVLAALLPATAAWGAQKVVKPASDNCRCEVTKRTYTRKATQEVEQLFKAARQADEATFTRLIKIIPKINEYAAEDQPLLSALLYPAEGLKSKDEEKTWSQFASTETQQIRKAHQATLAAKERMLALALQQGAGVNDISGSWRTPPLHLAMVFGNPEIVRLLIKHGANINQLDFYNNNKSPIEFSLDHEYFVRMSYLPELVDVNMRTQMILDILAAGAPRPYLGVDEVVRAENNGKLERPAADYLIWPALAELTSGEKVMEAMFKTGTSPAYEYEDAMLSPLGNAARAGNLGGLKWLKAHSPRFLSKAKEVSGEGDRNSRSRERVSETQIVEEKIDLWVSAAVWALHPRQDISVSKQQTEAILAELIVPEMLWGQHNILRDDSQNVLIRKMSNATLRTGNTLLHHLVYAGHEDWVRRIVGYGAKVDGLAKEGSYHYAPPLSEAVLNANLPMVKLLLSLGADPLAGAEEDVTPLYLAIYPRDLLEHQRSNNDVSAERMALEEKVRLDSLALMMGKLSAQQKSELAKRKMSPLTFAYLNRYTDSTATVRVLLDAGMSASGLDHETLVDAINSGSPAFILELLDRGAKIQESESSTKKDAYKSVAPLLQQALRAGHPELMDRLLRAGALPNYRGDIGMSAVEFAISTADHKSLDFLLAHGGRIETTVQPSANEDDNSSTLDLAVKSGDSKMAQRIARVWKTDLSHSCMAEENGLFFLVVGVEDSYWDFLMNNGFGKSNKLSRCGNSAMGERLFGQIVVAPDLFLVGWPGKRLEFRLNTLWKMAVDSGQLPQGQRESLLRKADVAGRNDIVRMMQRLGVNKVASSVLPALPKISQPTEIDKEQQKKLAGHYYLKGVREVGSEIILRPDGHFEYMLAYGSVDELARGDWVVRNGVVILRTPLPDTANQWIPYKLVSANKAAAGNEKTVSVSVMYKQKAVKEISVTAIGCEAPEMNRGVTTDEGWAGQLSGQVCQIVLHHPKINGGRGFVYEPSASELKEKNRKFTFEYQQPDKQVESELNIELTPENGELIWDRSGRLMHYTRN